MAQSKPPPAYNESMHGQTSSQYAPAPTGESGEQQPPVRRPDTAYLKTPSGIAKVVEIVSIGLTMYGIKHRSNSSLEMFSRKFAASRYGTVPFSEVQKWLPTSVFDCESNQF